MDEFQTYRSYLFSIAYRMTGSASEAEDIVQDSYLRYQDAQIDQIRSPKSYLSTIVTRLCLDYLKSARAQREQYIGPWLPEPLLTVDDPPELRAVELRESLSTAFLVLLESLSPPERAVFLLREVFEYGYDEIATMLDISVANCRQIFHRAQQQIAGRRPRFEPSREAQRRLVERFLRACQNGDMAALTAMLAEDVESWSDGGGNVTTALNPIFGREKVLRLIAGLLHKAPPDLRFEIREVNDAPAILVFTGDRLIYAISLAIVAGRVLVFHLVANPDKLAYIQRQIDAAHNG